MRCERVTHAVGAVQNSITLVWGAALSNGAPISAYMLEQSDAETGTYEQIKTLEDCQYCVPNLHSGCTYWFRVRAENLVRPPPLSTSAHATHVSLALSSRDHSVWCAWCQPGLASESYHTSHHDVM